jgi:hypothetical protein
MRSASSFVAPDLSPKALAQILQNFIIKYHDIGKAALHLPPVCASASFIAVI